MVGDKIKHILIVEDDQDMHRLYAHMFENEEDLYQFEIIDDARLAYRYVERTKCDLIILDMKMEPMSGEEFYAVLRNDPKLKDIPVLVVSVVYPEDLVHLKKYGPVDFLKKPIKKEQLMEKLRDIIG